MTMKANMKRTTIVIEETTYKKLKALLAFKGMLISRWIREMVEKEVNKLEK